MSDLKIDELKPCQAEKRDFSNSDITLKVDGTLIFFRDGKLFSPRCERTERFKHIVEVLKQNNFPNCFGEMFYGNNVFDISSKENWNKALFMPIDIQNTNLNYQERQILLNQIIKEANSPNIKGLTKFKDFKEGWNYCINNNKEGLVIRNNREWYKVKVLKEAKVEIKAHETGKNKGTFILIDDNRISGTSNDFVVQFFELKSEGKTPIAEIEFPFITDKGHYFQPRLRRVFAKEDE
jgi:hypothetical protein